jgi:hypothetical protein
MEGVVYQHVERLAAFEPVYTEPTPEYIPFAYNVGFYVLAAPFWWIFGPSMFSLRLIAGLATLGIGVVLFAVLKRATGSSMWALWGSGLFAASYVTMDSYLDTAHTDSCFVLSALVGTAILDRRRTRGWRLVGLALLVVSFWFKQHGALFAIAGVVYLTLDEGLRRSWPYWLLVIGLGPAAYLFLGPTLFGPEFHYFTYQVPSAWSEYSLRALIRMVVFFGLHYFWMALAAAGWYWLQLRKGWAKPSVWQVQLIAALATAVMASLDYSGASNNVYIPLGVWLILTGVWGLWCFEQSGPTGRRTAIPLLALVLSFSLAAFDPRLVMRSQNVDEAYADFVQTLRSLDGTVYAPTLGQLPRDFTLYPAAHWVALDDMIRGPGREITDHPMVQELMSPLLDDSVERYILANYPLTTFGFFGYLTSHYELVTDFGDRFRALEVLPSRGGGHKWPRYLYRLDPSTVSVGAAPEST